MKETDPATGPARQAIVEARHVTKVYRGHARKGHPDVVAVDDVDLTVAEGELVVLLGPSGCGKTTLLRAIAGLERPDRGEIRIGDRIVHDAARGIDRPPEDRHIGMMFQSYALWPHMTVFQNVAYPLLSRPGVTRDAIRARVADQLLRLGVAGMDHRFPGELSGGQQQRVALARALIGAPSVILFDEPLSNVDAKVRRRLRAELRDLKAQSRFAGIYVTHDQEEAMELADSLAVMEQGRIRQRASGREVYDRPASMYVADFVGEINRWPGRVEGVDAGNVAQVATSLGRFEVPQAPASVRAGDDGWLVIRPERVRLGPAPDGGTRPPAAAPSDDAPGTGDHDRGEDNLGEDDQGKAYRFAARVHDAIDFGARLEIRARIGEAEVLAWLPDGARRMARPGHGDTVEVRLTAASLRWLPA